MNAFLTGSHVYGTPRADSDVDIVVLVEDAAERKVLCDNAEWRRRRGTSLMVGYGKLNLIVCPTPAEQARWLHPTLNLIMEKPVNKERANSEFDKFFGPYVHGQYWEDDCR